MRLRGRLGLLAGALSARWSSQARQSAAARWQMTSDSARRGVIDCRRGWEPGMRRYDATAGARWPDRTAPLLTCDDPAPSRSRPPRQGDCRAGLRIHIYINVLRAYIRRRVYMSDIMQCYSVTASC